MNKEAIGLLEQHINALWLRPESAIWEAVASYEIRRHLEGQIDLDLGSGNGIFSYITAGGRFTEDFDWFVQADPSRPGENVFDHFKPKAFRDNFIAKKPDVACAAAFDRKQELLDQAATLGWYGSAVQGDIARPLPFEDASMRQVFSNIVYWIKDPNPLLRELHRVVVPGGRLLLCLPDPAFVDFCPSYKWRCPDFRWLKGINRERAACIMRYFSPADVKFLAAKHGFRLVARKGYLTKELLGFWDVGLRPLIRPLLRMTARLTPAERRDVKREWTRTLVQDMAPMLKRELSLPGPKGFHLFVLERGR